MVSTRRHLRRTAQEGLPWALKDGSDAGLATRCLNNSRELRSNNRLPFRPMGNKRGRRSPKKRPQRPSTSSAKSQLWQQQAAEDYRQGRFVDALEKLDRVICEGQPDAKTWILTGSALIAVGEYAQAIDAGSRAVELAPDDLESNFNWALAHYQMGEVSAAVQRFLRIADRQQSLSALANAATIIPGCEDSSPADILRVRREFGIRLLHEEQPTNPQDPFAYPSAKHQRVRIGFVSAYFHQANYMRPVWSLINQLDRDNFAVHLFADDARPDAMTWFQKSLMDEVHDTSHESNADLAAAIRALEIDILVDLNAYSIPTRLPLYVYRLAPLVVAWFNMYATSGLPGIDSVVGDPWVAMPGDDTSFSESMIRLPHSYLSFGEIPHAPPVAAAPSSSGAPFTFGSLISQYKMTRLVFDAWSEILHRVPEARLLLGNRAVGSSENRKYILDQFQRREIVAAGSGFCRLETTRNS